MTILMHDSSQHDNCPEWRPMGCIAKPRLLYISPVIPSLSAHGGTAKRAFWILEALSRHFRISLLVGLASTERRQAEVLPAGELCETVTWLQGKYGLRSFGRRVVHRVLPQLYHAIWSAPSDWSVPTRAVRTTLQRIYAGVQFDCVHVFRLRMLPLVDVLSVATKGAALQLDLDEVESVTRCRIADLAQHNGDRRLGRDLSNDASKYAAIEGDILARCDRIFVASNVERTTLAERCAALRCGYLPNIVEIPARMAEEPRGGAFVFLFVGSIDYYPNADAVKFFCLEVLPRLQRLAKREIEVRIVGHSRRQLRRLVADKCVKAVPPESHLTGQYQNAHVVVVPIRAGGGTRIKALEAFAYGRAVVGTKMGLEGLNVESRTHAIIADSPDDFAAACARLIDDTALRQHLVANARALVEEYFSPRAMRAALLNPV